MTVATLETFDNFSYTLKLGGNGEGDRHVQVAVSANLPKDRAPGKDEKPEDKTKLDKEFAEKNKKLEDKLKAEKVFEKWTYTIAKYTVDQLLKERRELLAEKKDEAKAEQTLVPPPSVVSPPVRVPLAPPAEPKESPKVPPAPPVSVVSPAVKAPSAPPPVPPAVPPAPAPAPKKSDEK